MKTSTAIITILVVLFLSAIVLISINKNNEVTYIPPSPSTEEDSIKGCYVATIDKDVYTLNIQSQNGAQISGTLDFRNFQKDSSHGTFNGTYTDGVLLGDYSFSSEGTDSVMQVIFKKFGEDFVRGYGELDSTGTRFSNLEGVTYDISSPLAVFKKSACL